MTGGPQANREGRRRLLKGAALGGAVAWSAPAVSTVGRALGQEGATPPPDGDPPPACSIDSNLATWVKAGWSGYNWVVSGTDQVTQTQADGSARPGFFLSPSGCQTVTFSGTLRVATASDDDMIGLVMGYSAPVGTTNTGTLAHDLIFFDWKKNGQSFGGFIANEGYALTRVVGDVTYDGDQNGPFWGKDGTDPRVTVLATDYSTTKGWVAGTTYSFSVAYSASNITISIGGTEIFNVNGSFPAGRIGFYNNSQENVVYTLSSVVAA